MTAGGALRVMAAVMGLAGVLALVVLVTGERHAPPSSWFAAAGCLIGWRIGFALAERCDHDG